MPGATQETVLVGHAMLCLSKTASRDAGQLIRFLGGTDRAGELWMHSGWIRELNMAVPYEELYAEPECRAHILERSYPPLAGAGMNFLLTGRRAAKAPGFLRLGWYKEFERVAHRRIRDQLILARTATPRELTIDLAALAAKLGQA